MAISLPTYHYRTQVIDPSTGEPCAVTAIYDISEDCGNADARPQIIVLYSAFSNGAEFAIVVHGLARQRVALVPQADGTRLAVPELQLSFVVTAGAMRVSSARLLEVISTHAPKPQTSGDKKASNLAFIGARRP